MHAYLLSISSNFQARSNLTGARRMLEKLFPEIVFTEALTTKPHGDDYKRPFVNVLAVAYHSAGVDEINAQLKEIEKRLGRTPEDKAKGKVVIDLDLIAADGKILRLKDFERSYVQDLLPQIDSKAALAKKAVKPFN